jgi:tetratricopeptide (TPR) repeat protein
MSSEPASDLKFEIGHVLFIDIVGYSKLLITKQSEQIQKLRQIVREQGLGWADAARDHFAQARSAALTRISANPGDPATHLDLAWLDATLDYPDQAVTEAQRAVELSKKDTFYIQSDSLVALAAVYAKLGRADDAIAVLYQLSATPSGWAICASDLRHDPDWDRIRNDPRFVKIVASFAPNDTK